jgi:hypothetical protein
LGRKAQVPAQKNSASAKGASHSRLMPQSFAGVTLQIAFSTKDREPQLTELWVEDQVHIASIPLRRH